MEEITPISDSTEKVTQQHFGFSFAPTAPSRFPVSYADNNWDIAQLASSLAELIGTTGTFTQHDLNELFARLILALLPPPVTHQDFSDDFSSDFY